MQRERITKEAWQAEAERRFGPNPDGWRFKCPTCGHVASVKDWRDAGAPEGAIAFSCIGRWMTEPRDAFGEGRGPCNYAGGGLFPLNPVDVDGHCVFAFAEPATEASHAA